MNVNEMVTYEEFNNLPEGEQKEKLTLYRNLFTNKDIMKRWNINPTKLYYLIDKHQLPKSERGVRKNSVNKKPKKTVQQSPEVTSYIVGGEKLPVTHKAPEVVDGIALMIKGKYSAEKLIHRLERTVFMLLDEEADFEIELKIREVL